MIAFFLFPLSLSSFSSEESCSSSAVRGETINSSPPNLMPRKSRRISSHLVRPE
ncbi:hypothetical protein V6Z12_A01G184100 [Gossypium hirsutum]